MPAKLHLSATAVLVPNLNSMPNYYPPATRLPNPNPTSTPNPKPTHTGVIIWLGFGTAPASGDTGPQGFTIEEHTQDFFFSH